MECLLIYEHGHHPVCFKYLVSFFTSSSVGHGPMSNYFNIPGSLFMTIVIKLIVVTYFKVTRVIEST